MHRRTALQLLAGGLGAASVARPSTAHPTPTGGDSTETATGPHPDADYGPLGSIELPGADEVVVSADGTTAFVAVGNGYAIVDVSNPAKPQLLAERRNIKISQDLLAGDLGDPFDSITDVAIDTDTLIVVNDGETTGALVVDVSTPASPNHRAFYQTEYRIHNCDVAGGRAYLTVDFSGGRLDIIDIRGSPERVGTWSLVAQNSTWEALPTIARDVHDVFVQNNVAYLAHWDAGTWLVDVSDPAELRVLAHIGRDAEAASAAYDREADTNNALPGNSHYAAVNEAGTLLAVGREASASDERPAGGPGGIDLYEVSDSTKPHHRGTIAPPEDPDGMGGRWTTAHNFELQDGVLYSSWYNGGVMRHDVSDPSEPTKETWWANPSYAEFFAARAGIPGESFIGSSRGWASVPGRLYTFPDSPGETAWEYGEGVPEAHTPRTPAVSGDGLETELLAGVGGLGVVGLAGLLWRRWRQR